ncbi:hypothetical protein M0R72_15995 [Candidatus Pacearchaeota archaeon]|jgi:hypothetical protein|nr:hypothetical protein [Candidatus Pacearchaeota archaeon]
MREWIDVTVRLPPLDENVFISVINTDHGGINEPCIIGYRSNVANDTSNGEEGEGFPWAWFSTDPNDGAPCSLYRTIHAWKPFN